MPIPEHMLRFILERDLCVMSTASPEGVPHASLMAYAALPDLRYIYMGTLANTRKWANLTANPELAVLVDEREVALYGERSTARALTVGGRHEPVTDPQDKMAVLNLLTGRHPHLEFFFATPGMELIRLSPRWLMLLTGAEQSEFIELKNN